MHVGAYCWFMARLFVLVLGWLVLFDLVVVYLLLLVMFGLLGVVCLFVVFGSAFSAWLGGGFGYFVWGSLDCLVCLVVLIVVFLLLCCVFLLTCLLVNSVGNCGFFIEVFSWLLSLFACGCSLIYAFWFDLFEFRFPWCDLVCLFVVLCLRLRRYLLC